MQNKHQFFFLVVGVPTFGEGSSRLGQNPKFAQKIFWTAPLRGVSPRWYSMPVSSLASLCLWLIISDAGNIVKNHIMNNLSVGRLNPQRHYSEGKWMGRGKAERRKRRTMSLPNLANQQQEGVGLCETQLECAKQDLIFSDISYKWLFQRLG